MKIKLSTRNMLLALCFPLLIATSACDRPNNVASRERTAGEMVDDKALTSNVRSALDSDPMKFPDIKVAAYRGVVQLSGFADTREQKEHAVDVAKNVTGVRKVEDSVTIKEAKKP